MTKFKTDEALGQVVDPKFRMFCAIGVDPITKLDQLRNAAGATKFGQLCGFIFTSLNKNIDFKEFAVSFVAKVRSKIYRKDPRNQAHWYVFKKLGLDKIDALDKQSTFLNYGFDIDKFMDSDVMKAAIPQFIKTITKGLGDCRKFAETLSNSQERAEAMIYIRSIEESLELIKSKNVNDKYFSLQNLDVHQLGATRDQIAKITKSKLSNIDKVNTQWMNKAHGDEDKYLDRSAIGDFEESDNVDEAVADWQCIVKKENNEFAVYEKNSGAWVATFPDENTAEGFCKEYPALKEKYVKQNVNEGVWNALPYDQFAQMIEDELKTVNESRVRVTVETPDHKIVDIKEIVVLEDDDQSPELRIITK